MSNTTLSALELDLLQPWVASDTIIMPLSLREQAIVTASIAVQEAQGSINYLAARKAFRALLDNKQA